MLGMFNTMQNLTLHALEELKKIKAIHEGNFPEANKK